MLLATETEISLLITLFKLLFYFDKSMEKHYTGIMQCHLIFFFLTQIIEKHGEVEMAQLRESTKRRKIEVNSALNPNLKCSSSFLGMDSPCSPCSKIIPQQENPPSSPQYSPGEDYNTNPCVQSNEQDILSPEHHFYENDTSFNEGSFRDDIFPFSPPDLEETKRDEEITRLKLLLKEQEAALEEFRKKMKQS